MRWFLGLLLLVDVSAEEVWHGACPAGCNCFAQTRGSRYGCAVEVHCTQQSSSFPTGYAPETDCLLLSNAKLGALSTAQKTEMFSAMPAGLKSLDLSMSGLGGGDGLPAAAFSRFTKLRFLNLEFNSLTSLPANIFHGLGALRTLWLTGNHYHEHEPEYAAKQAAGNNLAGTLDVALFRGLDSLQVLLMHHNKLTALPAGLFADTRMLRVLKLVDNAFEPRLRPSDPVFATLLARTVPTLPLCAADVPSMGGCLQLDLSGDSGDALEDIWDALGIGLADDATVLAAPQDMHGLEGGEEDEEDERRDDEDHDEI